MPEHNTDRERIEFALKTERDGHTFYKVAAKMTAHKLARAAFELLGKEELKHVELIEALDKRLAGEGDAPEVEPVGLGELQSGVQSIYETAGDENIEGEMDPAEAYETAIELEKRVTSLYARYSEESDDDAAKRLFAVLQKEEEHHLNLLEDMHAYLTKPEEWFINRDGVMLDGG